MRVWKKTAASVAVLVLTLLLGGCASELPEGVGESLKILVSPDETYDKADSSAASYEMEDKASLYEADDTAVVTMYLTVGYGNEADGTSHTWEEVNAQPLRYYEENGIDPYKCEAVLQVGDENGPLSGEFGYGETTANATVRLRGEGASEKEQKSYRIDIKSGKGSWNDQKAIVLNKYSSDELRFTNRLTYSLMEAIPQMISARTRLVHLYVKDKTEGEDGLFVDYGLYTQVEQINKTYLKNHGFDSTGQLYEAENFDFGLHEDSLMLATSPDYDLDAFEQYLEVKGDEDHSKLLEMLRAVNDPDTDISSVLDTYFDRDNLYAWLAFHLLTGNREAATSHFYLYSPQGVDKWYFISGNSSDAFSEIYDRLKDDTWSASWDTGIFSFTDSVLFTRIFRDAACREEFLEVTEELYTEYLTEKQISEEASALAEIVKPYLYSLPDSLHQQVTSTVYDILVASLADEVEQNYERVLASMSQPWPFHILEPEADSATLTLQWEEAYLYTEPDSEKEEPVLTYTVELADSWTFSDCILSETGMEGTSLEIDLPEPGQYFVRIRAETSAGYTQEAYEFYNTEKERTVYSTLCFYIREDGSVEQSLFTD
ncbi:MAG: CotH kinase family protein [Lachnospiraceae bacterium]|nr:CotH kinase family protein [Lachnospiraceae bacterium]